MMDLVTIVVRLREVYTEQGVAIWLGSVNRNLDNHRPIDLLAHGGDVGVTDVLDEVDRIRQSGEAP